MEIGSKQPEKGPVVLGFYTVIGPESPADQHHQQKNLSGA